MSRSSEKASNIAEELLDYVHPGMTHAAAIEEIATMIDEMNGDLLRVVNAMLSEEERIGPTRHAVLMNHHMLHLVGT